VLKAAPAAAITLACYDFVFRALQEARDAREGSGRRQKFHKWRSM